MMYRASEIARAALLWIFAITFVLASISEPEMFLLRILQWCFLILACCFFLSFSLFVV